ncbi:hypothetical protein JXL19_12800 [bacterium]|nr:hypothetical protein [bacterium]
MGSGIDHVEMVSIMVIMGTIFSMGVPTLRGMVDQGRLSRVEADFRTLTTAIESYNQRYKRYPGNSEFDFPYSTEEESFRIWQDDLIEASPRLLQQKLADPFGELKGDSYGYYRDEKGHNWVIWSIGPDQAASDPNSTGYRVDHTTREIICYGDDIVKASVPVIKN